MPWIILSRRRYNELLQALHERDALQRAFLAMRRGGTPYGGIETIERRGTKPAQEDQHGQLFSPPDQT